MHDIALAHELEPLGPFPAKEEMPGEIDELAKAYKLVRSRSQIYLTDAKIPGSKGIQSIKAVGSGT